MKGKKSPATSFPIVGIGASAGGLDALSRLLSHLATDTGMAFVVVQHLDPSRESLLPQILQKATRMPVAQAAHGVRIESDHVYVIPPNTHMRVDDGKLTLIPRPQGAQALSVNCFLTSLAEERGNQAIAVILSGTASDGALGVKAIKSEGGLVFAQDERSAEYFGMPGSAAATGVVDFILPPEKIAEELARAARHPLLEAEREPLLDETEGLRRIFVLLRRATGVDFSLYKSSTLKRRLLRRLMVHKFESLDKYLRFLEKNPDEVRALHDDFLIHVTHFFREPKCLKALSAKAFPRILKNLPAGAPIRVWVPGCSTGEEAYTLAILLLDFLGKSHAMNPVQIFATDISELALERARAGVYSEDIRHHVPPRLLRRFFTQSARGYEIVKRVRDMCVFARQDLTTDPPFSNVDVISCCNVLIYLTAQAQKKILPAFHYALRPAGVLVLGSAETVSGFEDLFVPADPKCRLYHKKLVASKLHFAAAQRHPAAPEREPAVKGKAAPRQAGWPETDIQRVAERLLIARFAPAGVIVNAGLDILHFHGRVNRYLEPAAGKASLNLMKMLPAHSVRAIGAMIQKSKKSDAPVQERGIDLGGKRGIAVQVLPFRLPLSGERYFIVLFDDSPAAFPASKETTPGREPVREDHREAASVKRLKSELASTRSYLQTIAEEHEAATEELKSANEEIVSSNEELQSTNEELEVAKEELQATNEELSTVNDELQARNAELSLLNNDLSNLIASVHLPIVMVSADMRVRRFNPMAEKLMNLLPGDAGRLIGDLKPKIVLPNIEEIIHDVIETVASKELAARDSEGHSFSVRIRPYRTQDNKIEGAVLVFMDNDPVKRSPLEIEEVSAFETLMEISEEPVVVLDARMRVKSGSRSMYQSFGLTESLLGHSLFEVDDGRWDVPELRAALERLADSGIPFTRLEVEVARRALRFSARRISLRDGGPPLILMTVSRAG